MHRLCSASCLWPSKLRVCVLDCCIVAVVRLLVEGGKCKRIITKNREHYSTSSGCHMHRWPLLLLQAFATEMSSLNCFTVELLHMGVTELRLIHH